MVIVLVGVVELYPAPCAEFFAYKASELERDKRGESVACAVAACAKYLVTRLRLFEHIPDNELRVLKVARRRARRRFARRYLERLEDVQRVGRERGAEADEQVRSETVYIADAVRYAQQFSIVFAGEARGDKRAGFRSRFHDEDRVAHPDHDAIAGGKIVRARNVRRL